MAGQVLTMLECELSVIRRGSLLVRINLEQGTMIWQDSRQWCNNFVRTLTDDQVAEFRSLIDQAALKSGTWPADPPETALQTPGLDSLQLTLCSDMSRVVFSRSHLDPAGWHQLHKAIERLSRAPFRL